MPDFKGFSNQGPIGAFGWHVFSINSARNDLEFDFTTAPNPGSLVGFTGGSISTSRSFVGGFYAGFSGSITPVPEPSSLVLFASGMLVLGPAWRFGKKIGHPLSA